MTLQEALAMLRTVVPEMERSIFIKAELKDYNHYLKDDPLRRQITFSVWDERDSFEGPTLEIAVQKCMLANVPDQAKIEEAEAAAVEAESLQTVANA